MFKRKQRRSQNFWMRGDWRGSGGGSPSAGQFFAIFE